MSARVSRKLLAPQVEGAALVEPPLAELVSLARNNHAAMWGDGDERSAVETSEDVRAKGKFLRAVRVEFVINSRFHTPDTRGPDRIVDDCSKSIGDSDDSYPLANHVVIAGHQPELFHPGVWFKNFLLSQIRSQLGASVVNVLIDNDAVRSSAISVPKWVGGAPRVEVIPFDAPDQHDGELAWEERPIKDWSVFESFGERVLAATASWPRTAREDNGAALIARLWPHAIHFARKAQGIQARLGATLAGARRLLEHEMGLTATEYPLSEIAKTWSFRGVALKVLSQLPLAHEQYNQALADHRALNRIRSASHPVPPLGREGDWLEAPYWIWTASDPRRRRLFARLSGSRIELTDRGYTRFTIDVGANDDGPQQWEEHEQRGIKVRPRALITTMYLRLYLSDLFIHGIGGAKYDELTDEIIRRFFGIEPPRYLTATATFRLPIDRPDVTIEDVRNSARTIRDVRYRPETLISHPLVAGDATVQRELQALAALKREYVRTHTLRRGSHDVFAGLDRLNDSMHDKLRPLESHLRAEHARLVEQLQQARTLGSREFSFVLFPEEYLVPRLLALASGEK